MLIATIVVLGVLIFVHELGHFLVAKRSGVTVLCFSLGFGPKIVGVTRGETEYRLSLIPLGGYVKMLGEDPNEEVSEEQQARSFSTQRVAKRFGIVLAGPVCNFILAIIIFAGIATFKGIPEPPVDPVIGSVVSGLPAEQAGVKENDRVLSINGKKVATWEELVTTISRSPDESIMLEIDRSGKTLTFEITPVVKEFQDISGEMTRRALIGIEVQLVYKPVNPALAVYYSFMHTVGLCKEFFTVIWRMIEGVISFKTLGGPILIAQLAGQQAEKGLVYFLNFMAVISVNLAVLNLLPIPVLDGGHLMFFTLEAVRRRPLSLNKLELAQKVGMLVLLVLMIFVFYNDIMRLMPGQKPSFMP